MTSQPQFVCKSCGSESHENFGGEVGLHFKGIEGLDKPIVFVFPEVDVCLSCGHAEFTVPKTELRVLQTNAPVENAAILTSSGGASNEQLQFRTEVKPSGTRAQKTASFKNPSKHRR